MKPKDWLVDLEKGMFWLPGKSEHEVPGIIVNRDGRLRLELIGTFSGDPHDLGKGSFYPYICGWLSNGGALTLVKCSSSISFSAPGMSTEQCSFSIALKGRHFESLADMTFDQIGVHFEGLSDWIGVSGLETTFELNDDVYGKTIWSARYVQPRPIEYRREDDVIVQFHSTASFPGERGRFDVALLQDCTMTLQLPTAVGLPKLQEHVREIHLLLTLLSGLSFGATYDFVSDNDIESDGRVERLPIVLNRQLLGDRARAAGSRFQRLDTFVPFEDVRNDFESLLDKWSEVCAKYGVAVHASLANSSTAPLDTRFLNLVNSLHRYKEADAGRKLKLADVLPQYLQPYCSEAVASRAKVLIEETRHFYTHYSPDLSERAAGGADLANAVDLLDLMNRCALLERIGFERERIQRWIAGSLRYRDFLHMNRWKSIGPE